MHLACVPLVHGPLDAILAGMLAVQDAHGRRALRRDSEGSPLGCTVVSS